MDHGAHYLLTVKDNQPRLRQNVAKKGPVPPTGFSPSPADTDLEPRQVDAAAWLERNRQAWDIETGLHARLDVSLLEDLRRIRTPRALWVPGMSRRLVVHLFVDWRTAHPRGRRQSLTDFHTVLGGGKLAPALRCLTSNRPSLKNLHA